MAAVANESPICPDWCDIHDVENGVCLGTTVTVDITDRLPYMAHALSVGLASSVEDGLTVQLAVDHVGPHEVPVAYAKAYGLAILAQVEAAEAAAAIPGPRTSPDGGSK